MKNFSTLLILFSISLLFSKKIISQETELIKVNFEIIEVINTDDLGEILVYIQAGKEAGISENAEGYLISKADSSNRKEILGHVNVNQVTNKFSMLNVVPLEGESNLEEIVAGDFVELEIPVLKSDYRSIFFNFITLNINFTTINGLPFYEYDLIFNHDSQSLETVIIDSMRNDIIRVGKKKLESSQNEIINGGKFKGQNLWNTMANATNSDILSCLRYIEACPEMYLRSKWRFAELYAGWIKAYTPFVFNDLKTRLLQETSVNTKAILLPYKDVINEEIINLWINEAYELSKAGQTQQANKLTDIALSGAMLLNNKTLLSWIYLTAAKVAKDLKNNNLRISRLIEAQNIFAEKESIAGLIATNIELGMAYIDTENYNKAISALEKAYELEQKLLRITKLDEINVFMAYTNMCFGDIYYSKQKFSKSANIYEDALKTLNYNELYPLQIRLQLLNKIISSYTELGQQDKANEFQQLIGETELLIESF